MTPKYSGVIKSLPDDRVQESHVFCWFQLQVHLCRLPQNYLEAKRRVKEVVEDDGLRVNGQANSMAGFEAYVQVLESQLTEMRKKNEKMMSLFIEQRTSTPPSLPFPFIPNIDFIPFGTRRCTST
jgi:hypothetical protein